jgi:hypothetical protein
LVSGTFKQKSKAALEMRMRKVEGGGWFVILGVASGERFTEMNPLGDYRKVRGAIHPN